jgi:hypothetical protein
MIHCNKVSAAVLAGVALGFVPVASHGLGFGRPVSRAILGERLQMQVPIRLEAGEDLAQECLASDVYVGEDKLPRGAVSLAVDRAVGASEATLRLQTQGALNEPVVTVYLIAGCQARVTRKFVLFVDPPSLAAAETAPLSATATAPSDNPAPADAGGAAAPSARRPAASAVARSAARASAARAATSPASDAGGLASPGSGGLSTSMGGAAKASKAAKADPGSRLLLDPVEQDALVLPELRPTATLGTAALDDSPASKERRAAAAALWQALNATPEQLARDRQRLAELEQRLVALQAESDKAKAALARTPPVSETAPAWLVAGLGALVLVLLPLVLWLGWRLWRAHRAAVSSDWMASAINSEPRDTGVDDDLSRTSVDFVRRPDGVHAPEVDTFQGELAHPAPLAQADWSAPAPASFTPAPVFQAPAPAPAPSVTLESPPASAPVSMASPVQREALREVSVEELIDLEQQAEFFVVLGQDDAAIDLLEGHVQSTTGGSPLPYLKLLEIYQRLGQRADYERVQADFNARFNGYAPAWEADLQQGHSLADYPGVIERLQGLWSTPARAMDVLEKSLTRPDHDAETFDLPAYRELLFLYAVARDLSERESRDRQAVDLLLPEMGGAQPASQLTVPGESEEVAPLMATRPIKAQPGARPSISLDLHLEDLTSPDPDPAASGVRVTDPLPGAPRTLDPLPFHVDDGNDTPKHIGKA